MKKFNRIAVSTLAAVVMSMGVVSPAHAFSSSSSLSPIQDIVKPDDSFPVIIDKNSSEAKWEQDVIDRTNEYRIANGLEPLEYDFDLYAEAKRWSQTQADANRMYHGDNWENIAWNPRPSGDAFFTQWKNSAPHRKNLLDARATKVGVGIVIDSDNSAYATMVLSR